MTYLVGVIIVFVLGCIVLGVLLGLGMNADDMLEPFISLAFIAALWPVLILFLPFVLLIAFVSWITRLILDRMGNR